MKTSQIGSRKAPTKVMGFYPGPVFPVHPMNKTLKTRMLRVAMMLAPAFILAASLAATHRATDIPWFALFPSLVVPMLRGTGRRCNR
jgi:hypothetical protein